MIEGLTTVQVRNELLTRLATYYIALATAHHEQYEVPVPPGFTVADLDVNSAIESFLQRIDDDNKRDPLSGYIKHRRQLP